MAYYLSLLHTPLGVLLFIVHLAVLARAITRPNRVPASRVAWVAIITFLPLLGVISYLLLGETSIGRQRIKRLRDVETRMPLPASAGVEPGKITAQIKPLFDLAQWLMDEGIESVSLNPDTVVDTWLKLAKSKAG